MSELIVEVVEIEDVLEHPNADRLEIAQVKGWACVVQKGRFKRGDKAVYLPIDSILPEDVENILFPPDSKIKLDKSRIRTIRLRGAISQGMIVGLETLGLDPTLRVGTSVKDKLRITKYEPPVTVSSAKSNCQAKPKKLTNPDFKEFTDLQHFKNFPGLFLEGERVQVTEKITEG